MSISVFKTPTDIFPPIKIPIVAAIWTYTGLLPTDMSGRIMFYYERSLTTTVSNIEHIESNSYYGSGVVKIYFQPGTDIAAAQAQVTATSQTVINQMPKGTTPPGILVFDASSVPVLALQVAATNMSPSDIYNLASNLIRPQLVSVPGAAIPLPYGGTAANVQVDLDREKLLQYGLSATDVGASAGRPEHRAAGRRPEDRSGGLHGADELVSARDRHLQQSCRSSRSATPSSICATSPTFTPAARPQQNIVLVKGQQSLLLEILKTGDASTLAVVSGIKALLPGIERTLPPGITIRPLNDQSGFVLTSILDVVQEMLTAAVLAGLTVLLFVGSWRSTLIVATSIPLAILSSIICLSALGQTINIMTLGGLALAVGILVDDATVMIENINTHLEEGGPEGKKDKSLQRRHRRGGEPDRGADLRVHALHLHRLAAAVPVGRRRRLPVPAAGGGDHLRHGRLVHPVAHADANAWRPTCWAPRWRPAATRTRSKRPGVFTRFQAGFERRFEQFRDSYRSRAGADRRTAQDVRGALPACRNRPPSALLLFVGQDFFPSIKSGEMDLHLRTPAGTRIEETSKVSVLADAGDPQAAARPRHQHAAELRPADQRHQPGVLPTPARSAAPTATSPSRSTTRRRRSRRIARPCAPAWPSGSQARSSAFSRATSRRRS